MTNEKNLLEVKNLKQHFSIPNGFLKSLTLKAIFTTLADLPPISELPPALISFPMDCAREKNALPPFHAKTLRLTTSSLYPMVAKQNSVTYDG